MRTDSSVPARASALILFSLLAASPALAYDAEPLPFPVYVACRVAEPLVIDGTFTEPAWRATSLGWGLSNSLEPNVLTPDPTLFRLAWDDDALTIALACYQRPAGEEIPENLWKPREPDIMDLQAVPRHSRMRGVIPPTNSADLLLSDGGRTVTLHFIPPKAPSARVHDSLGDRPVDMAVEYACQGDVDSRLWTAEARVTWDELGFGPPASGDDWALNLYRDIRFFSNWSYVAWMRDWGKAEYSRYDLTERFGRLLFVDHEEAAPLIDFAETLSESRGPVRVFAPDSLILVHPGRPVVRQRYADQTKKIRSYAEQILLERQRIGNDLPYHPFFVETKPREHLGPAARKLGELKKALEMPPAWDDPAAGAALVSHAIPEARQGLAAYQKERLYRGLPE